jgi:hypothetical protein
VAPARSYIRGFSEIVPYPYTSLFAEQIFGFLNVKFRFDPLTRLKTETSGSIWNAKILRWFFTHSWLGKDKDKKDKDKKNQEEYYMNKSHKNCLHGLTDVRLGSHLIQDMVICELELLSIYDNWVGCVK